MKMSLSQITMLIYDFVEFRNRYEILAKSVIGLNKIMITKLRVTKEQ